MSRKLSFVANQLVTLGVLLCLLGVSLEVSIFARPQEGEPGGGSVGGCPPQCEFSDAVGYCGLNPPPLCGTMNGYCYGRPSSTTCNLCFCKQQHGPGSDPYDCFCD